MEYTKDSSQKLDMLIERMKIIELRLIKVERAFRCLCPDEEDDEPYIT